MVYGLIMIAGGAFCVCCAYNDSDRSMTNYKALPFVKLFGRDGARKFYIGLGAFVILCGVIALFAG